MNSVPLLSTEFARSVGPNFFRPLVGEGRGVAIDLLANLATGFSRGRRSIPRTEATELLKEALVTHPSFGDLKAEGEMTSDWNDPAVRANHYLNVFIEAGWVAEDEFRYNVRKRTVVLDSYAQTLLAMIRELAGTSVQQTSRFSDTFRSVIDLILSPINSAFGQQSAHPFGALRDMADRCAKGMLVLRRIENLLRRFTREQSETESRRRNLELVVVELQSLTRTQYFRELNNPLLFQRCDAAADRLEELTYNSVATQRMAVECVAREEASDVRAAELVVLDQLRDLADTLRSLRGEAQQIERWATKFLSASLAKFRHLQTIPSRQLEVAIEQLDAVAVELAGGKWWQSLPLKQVPLPRLPELRLLWGTSSLWRPSRTNAAQAPAAARRPDRTVNEAVLQQLLNARQKAITSTRACAFVERMLPKKGDRIASEDLSIKSVETLVDVLSCLCYANASRINFRIDRPNGGTRSRYVPAGDWFLERFTLERTR